MPSSKKRSAKKGPKKGDPDEKDCAAKERQLLENATTMIWGDDGLRKVNAVEAQVHLNRMRGETSDLDHRPSAEDSREKNPDDAKMDGLRDMALRAGQHVGLYHDATSRFDATDYWYDKYMDEDDPRRVAFRRLSEGYKHVAHAWVELGASHQNNTPYVHWTRICSRNPNPESYVQAIEEHARHLEEEAWHAMSLPLVADVFGEQAISDGRLIQMLCVFVVQTFLPDDLSVVTNCTNEEMIGMLQFGWKYLITLGRLVTFVDIRNVMTNAAAYVAWSRCNGWRYDTKWGSIGEWFSRLHYFSSNGNTPSLKRSPNGMPTNALIDLVRQAKNMGEIGVDTPHWRKAIDPWLLVECTRRPDVAEFVTMDCVKLPLTTSSTPAEFGVLLQAVGERLAQPDVAAWFKDTPFEARWHVCVLNLANPSTALVNILCSAVIAWINTCHGEMQRARQMYGSTFGCDSVSIATIVPEWGYAIVDSARKTSAVELAQRVDGVIVAPHIPRAFAEAHADAVKLGVSQPMASLSAATLTRPEDRVAPTLVAQVASMLRRSRFAGSVEEAIEGSKQRTGPYAWQQGAPFAFRLTYCGAFSGLPSFGRPQLCEDLMFLTQARDLAGSDARDELTEAMGALVDEAALVRPNHTFAKSGLIQRRVDVPGVGLWAENPKAFRTWIWECCMGIVELVFPFVEERNATGIPFHNARDLCLLRCVDDSVVHSFCLPVQACTSAQELRSKIAAALRQSLVAVAARLTACKQIGNPVHRPKLRSMLGWKWPDDRNDWRTIEPVYHYEWPVRHVDSKANALTGSLAKHPHRMPKAIARRYIAILECTDSVTDHAAHAREMSTWKRCLEAAPAGARFCGGP